MRFTDRLRAAGAAGLRDAVVLRGTGAVAGLRNELHVLQAQLESVPDWAPSHALLAEVAWCTEKLETLQADWDRKLVVALVGPSGAGKSTLLNALAGRDLSEAGRTRPTTRQVVVYARSRADAEEIVDHCGSDRVQVAVDYEAPALEYLVLVDTPDTNTLPENQRLLARLLERADVLLAVFPAHNPKMQDNIAFLGPYVGQLPPDAVVPVLNMVDRVPRDELGESVLPDFREAIVREWGLQPKQVYAVSALAGLPGTTFVEDEQPLHAVNEIGALREWLASSLNRESQLSDRRLARAEHLVSLVHEDVAQALKETSSARRTADAALLELDRKAQRDLLDATLAQTERVPRVGLQAPFYDLLEQRWWGPVGWLVTVWVLFLRLGATVGRWVRPSRFGGLGRPNSDRSHSEASASLAGSTAWEDVLARRYAEEWPPVAEALIGAGFGPQVRGIGIWRESAQERAEALGVRWAEVYEASLTRLARGLSSWPLQILWNAPTLGMVGWVAYQTIGGFFAGEYLPADYFRHAAIATLTLWLLSFVLLQVLISWTLRGPLLRRVARGLREATADGTGVLREQLVVLEEMERG